MPIIINNYHFYFLREKTYVNERTNEWLSDWMIKSHHHHCHHHHHNIYYWLLLLWNFIIVINSIIIMRWETNKGDVCLLQWDDWVLCRIYKKRASLHQARQCSRETGEVDSFLFDDVLSSLPEMNQLAESYDDRWRATEMAIGYQEQQFPNHLVNEVPNVFCIESAAYVRDSMVQDSSIFMQQIDGYCPRQQQQQPNSYLAGQYQWSRSSTAPM